MKTLEAFGLPTAVLSCTEQMLAAPALLQTFDFLYPPFWTNCILQMPPQIGS